MIGLQKLKRYGDSSLISIPHVRDSIQVVTNDTFLQIAESQAAGDSSVVSLHRNDRASPGLGEWLAGAKRPPTTPFSLNLVSGHSDQKILFAARQTIFCREESPSPLSYHFDFPLFSGIMPRNDRQLANIGRRGRQRSRRRPPSKPHHTCQTNVIPSKARNLPVSILRQIIYN